ncbi:hypothetical protein GCM10009555_103380 [Acrocarpospora macrocephala]|uniref:FAD dependent oxidoreductase domain-containing protein n=1 Tax=Acrocarpospora macrocephala TaxID=150177 RepID=A0A5M3WGL3_9ACTN|nr:FAD-binding oxidoreductase [Acrocarpospora macrocephala]GES07262.1 hypothetical protein Amac_008570 [Acrocarpospora macrocephala]
MAATDKAGLPTIGLLAYTRPRALPVSRLLTTSRLSLRPQPDGSLVLHGLDLDRVVDPDRPPTTRGAEAEELLRRLEEVVSLAERPEIARLQIGRRSIPVDGKTVEGFVGEGEWFYAIATHSGVTLAPLLAEYCVQEVVRGGRVEELSSFRPERFAGLSQRPETPRATVPGDQ